MARSKLQRVLIVLIPFLLNTEFVLAADAKPATTKPADVKTEAAPKPDVTTPKPVDAKKDTVQAPEQKAEAKKEPSAFEKFLDSKFVLSSGFGFIRASKSGDLRANGFADVKASYLTPLNMLAGRKIYATFRYFPFAIAPDSDVNKVYQGYSGIVETFAVGADVDLSFVKNFDFLASAEIGAYKANFTELAPVKESHPPLTGGGGLLILGAEFLFKPFEKFKVGPRVNFGGGSLSFVSLALNSSFYF